VLDVRGMKCGGCSAAVRRILVADPAIEAAAVNLLTESAVVRMRRPPHADPHTEPGLAAAELLTARVRATAACGGFLAYVNGPLQLWPRPSALTVPRTARARLLISEQGSC